MVVQQGVQVQKKSSSIMMLVAVYAKDDRYTADYVANFANVYVLDALKRVQGAGQAQVMGEAAQAMRIWMNPDRMASLQVTTSDIQNAIAAQNALFGAGQVGQQPTPAPVQLTFPVVTQRPFTDPKTVREHHPAREPGRRRDRARRRRGARERRPPAVHHRYPAERSRRRPSSPSTSRPARTASSSRRPMRKTLEEMKSRFPDGIETVIALDTNDFVRLSIEEVIHTLIIAMILVVLVVFLFLQSLRTTFICAVAIVVALVGTFAGMLALGFSINLLTLFGLVLAIGMVVDDAIVVVENVERIMAKDHLPPKEATIKCMGEIGSSLVAVVLVMASVFVPAAFLPGTTGQLYKQFAITIVVSVAVSGLVALTLTPAMCGALLRHSPPPQRGPFAWFNRQVDRITQAFGHAVTMMIKRMVDRAHAARRYSCTRFITSSRACRRASCRTRTRATASPRSSCRTRRASTARSAVAERVDAMLAKIPGVDQRSMLSGYSLLDYGYKTNAATFFITFSDFKERYATLESAKARERAHDPDHPFREVQAIEGAMVFPVPPPAIPGIGTTGGFEFWVQDTTAGEPARLDDLTQEVIRKAAERPELAGLHTTFRATTPQLPRRCRSRQGDAARRAGRGRLRRRSRRSSARSRSASSTSSARCGG